jgi:hypothetical protein
MQETCISLCAFFFLQLLSLSFFFIHAHEKKNNKKKYKYKLEDWSNMYVHFFLLPRNGKERRESAGKRKKDSLYVEAAGIHEAV